MTNAQLVPIRVGMILPAPINDIFFKTCPHTRGDDPSCGAFIDSYINLSPYAWG